jgi:amicyanin
VEPTLAHPEPTPKPGRARWRIGALAAASAVALAACGASAAGTPSNPTATTPAAPASSAPPPNPGTPTSAAPAPAAAADVSILNFKFTPAALTIKAGTTVTWTNKDAIGHTVNFMTGGINSNVLNHNDQFAYTFTTPGTYDYICSIHPFMHGSVTVTT